MHPEAFDGARRMFESSGVDLDKPYKALDLGGVNVNGNARVFLPNATWTGLDISNGAEVDIVADARTWRSKRRFDVVLSTELFEHTDGLDEILQTIAHHMNKNGPQLLVITCASTGREPHGCRGTFQVPPGEWYRNIPEEELRDALEAVFEEVHVEYNSAHCDLYAWAKGVK
jgi:hypothetical protein